MMYHKSKEIVVLIYRGKTISAAYYGARLIWQSLRSCFSAGYWDDTKPWLDDEGWKDN